MATIPASTDLGPRAAARARATDVLDGRGVREIFGTNEREIAELVNETVLAWRSYLPELSAHSRDGG